MDLIRTDTILESRGSSVSIGLRSGLNDRVSIPSKGLTMFN
jgi:hypothetical protein